MLLWFVIIYWLISVAIGLYAATRVHNTKDFAIAGRHLPFYMVTATVFATWFGSETVLGIPATFLNEGLHGVVADPFGSSLCLILVGLFLIRFLGIVMIPQDSLGIVTKKFNLRGARGGALPDGRIIALNGEAGLQADTLPPGLYFWMFSWQYRVDIVKFTTIPPGNVGVVEARDGKPLTLGHVFAANVDSDSFQNARAFLTNGGERGPQVNVITPGTYRINTQAFDVAIVPAFEVPQNKIGIVTMADGAPLNTGEIAGKMIDGHNGFQNGHAFIVGGAIRVCRNRC